jgi:hypothetical protein
MANHKKGLATTEGGAGTAASTGKPKSLAIAERGIKTGNDFANLMSSLMSDIIEGRVTPSMGNATCNAGGKLLKVVEMQYKYGTTGKDNSKRLVLAVGMEDAALPLPNEKVI